ncbi:MAG: GIY-YIG nuclease family protein [Methanosarcinales archaeon]
MYWVYFLYSENVGSVYVGCTGNLQKRLKEHNDGLVKSTKNRRPFILIHSEKYSNFSIARRREEYLKSLYGSRERKRILKNYLENDK